MSKKLTWKIYSAILGAVTAIIAQKTVTAAWKLATGDNPPNPNDPSVPASQAAIWVASSGIGLGVAQMVSNRYLARRWAEEQGSDD